MAGVDQSTTCTPRKRPRRRLRVILLIAAMVVIAAMVYVGGAITYQPSWYQPLSVDYQWLEEDKRAQLRVENTISAALNENRTVEFKLDQARLNRWIAARDELWPTEVPSIEPFSHPLVILEGDNVVRLATRVEYSGARVVLSARFRIEPREDDLVVSWDCVRAGTLPAPGKLLEKAAREVAARLNLPAEAVGDGRLVLPREGLWPNGKRPFRLTSILITAGEVHVQLEPL